MNAGAIDPAISGPVALSGRVVTMDAAASVLEHGVVYCRDGSIVEVGRAGAPPPAGFEAVPVTATRGTIYPGLIELHNHMPYNVLSLWSVPRLYSDRDQWSGRSTPQYRASISGPMGVLGRDTDVVPAIVRFVEMRALLGGTTTSQGVALASSSGIVTHFRGLVRNVESTKDPDLPPATTHVADVEATDAEQFLARISGTQKLILHLSEGSDQAAHDHFEALHLDGDRWAITENLVGIHCVALTAADFEVLAGHGGSMVWSPLSNLLLYGSTADVAAARRAGVPIALGADWAPSGSKNLLGELKVARIYADANAIDLSDLDLVRMATSNPAAMLGWDEHLGSLENGKRADLVVLDGRAKDPYQQLIDATEADVHLVMINGVPRVGTPGLMQRLGPIHEQLQVGERRRALNLAQATADPSVAALSVGEALDRLRSALQALAATDPDAARRTALSPATLEPVVDDTAPSMLAVSNVIDNHMSSRPHLPLHGRLTGPQLPVHRDAEVLASSPAQPFPPLHLDPLAAVDNEAFYAALGSAANIPEHVRTELRHLAPA